MIQYKVIRTIDEFMEIMDNCESFGVSKLVPGDVLTIVTDNHTYRARRLKDGYFMFTSENNDHFSGPEAGQIYGTSLVGRKDDENIVLGKLVIGYRPLIVVANNQLAILSAVREVHLNDTKVIPAVEQLVAT